ncbi:hypothetical protein [Bacillus tuaregi]|uniref:hypothetical protein n=1 Tax=Bacillus tuaregi TaxID=1816695 RepID=UPI0008F85455|nr:hypothetical protein [Bacillus tuaregi]
MWNVVTVIGAALAVILLEKKQLKNSWQRKEKVVFFTSLIIGTFLCVGWQLNIRLINPVEIIEVIYRPISKPLTLYLGQFR